MRVAVIGTGYVGLSTGAVLAFLEHDVCCVDSDATKVARLRRGEVPFHEPGLPDVLALARERIRFSTNYAEAVRHAEVTFIAVGTPSLPSGEPDLSQVCAAADAIGPHLGEGPTVIVTKSTVPIGSGNWIEHLVHEAAQGRENGVRPHVLVASSPEFLREGAAMHDAFYPDRIVVGADDERAFAVLSELYRPLLNQSFVPPPFLPRPAALGAVPLVTTDLASAELIKYAANAFLALKISFINDLGTLAERVGADILKVARGIGLDRRIGLPFLQAGVGWGGSCFGKDTAALLATAREYGLELPTVRAARDVNVRQRSRAVEKLQRELKILKGRVIALLGLAFKPDTDDLRDAPAVEIAGALAARGAKVRAHDPVACRYARSELADLPISLCERVDDALRGADAALLVTEWPEYREIDWEAAARAMRTRIVVDGRNVLDGALLGRLGFRYVGMGVGEAVAAPTAGTAHQPRPDAGSPAA